MGSLRALSASCVDDCNADEAAVQCDPRKVSFWPKREVQTDHLRRRTTFALQPFVYHAQGQKEAIRKV